uniref:UspA domain-containing protein n=1 Tax=Gossypium raimondii TaxID=29730 RepID=A0A0D2TPD4_GOSRA|nr:hypothetical protein B456_007G304400 [Gossypium raimondii]
MAEDDVVAKDRKILVAVDEGEESTNALSWCLKNVISHTSKDTLVLLYAKPPRAVYTSLDGTGYLFSSDILATMDKYSNDVADCVIEKAKRVCREQGDPEVADKINADVLVMGSHGYGLIKRAFLGSVSNHCAQNVKCPVLIVKKPTCSSSASGTK